MSSMSWFRGGRAGVFIVRTHPIPPEVNFDYLLGGWESEKCSRGWKYGAGAGILKRAAEGEGAETFPISFCKVYHLYI